MGRGKVERAFETVQQQFLVEVTGDEAHPARRQVKDLAELNDLLDRWVRAVYHARVHSETGETRRRGMPRPGRRSFPSRCCCGRRSGGARSGWSARPRPWLSRATCTRSTRSSRAGRWSWSSTRYDELRIAGPMVSRALCGELVVRGHRTRCLALSRMHNCPRSESSEECHQGVRRLVAPRLGSRRAGAGESAFFDRQIAVDVHADGRLNLLVA